jgi:ComF family protein
MIVPVPLHRWRLLKRRYNQAALLAWGLARETGKTCLPEALIRIRQTPPQGHKRARDRVANVKRAFAVNPRDAERLAGRSVLLVDDVFTTGATLRECAQTLLGAGVRDVHVLTVARVLRA